MSRKGRLRINIPAEGMENKKCDMRMSAGGFPDFIKFESRIARMSADAHAPAKRVLGDCGIFFLFIGEKSGPFSEIT